MHSQELDSPGKIAEQFWYDYLCFQFGLDAVQAEPVLIYDRGPRTPDFLIMRPGSDILVYLEVTTEGYPKDSYRKDPKFEVRTMFASLGPLMGGIIAYQQHVLTLEGLDCTKVAIEDLLSGETNLLAAQETLDRYARYEYQWDVLPAPALDWKARMNHHRYALGMPLTDQEE